MKTERTKLHHRKTKAALRSTLSALEAADIWDMDHDHPDLDSQLYRIARSPKQENL